MTPSTHSHPSPCLRQLWALPNSRNTISWIALFSLLLCEVAAWRAIRTGNWHPWGWLAAIGGAIIALLWLVSRNKGFKFRIRSEILTKLLANTISPSLIGAVYLLAFAVHLGWLTDTVMNLYLCEHAQLLKVGLAILTCLVGGGVVACFFPDGRRRKSEKPTKVLVSGISTPGINLITKTVNLRPLVSMFRLVDDANCEMLILCSDFASKKENVSKGINDILTHYDQKEIDADMPLTEQLDVVIREAAKREFPDKAEWIGKMTITFTKPCDYNDFTECFNELSPWIKKLDDNSHLLAFNLTPGTGIVGSLMTLMAINADRDLYYYSQDNSLKDDQRLKLVDKTGVPLHNLLSQALENVEAD